MGHTALKLVANAAGLLLVAYLIPGFTVANFTIAVIVALVLAFFNIMLKPVLMILTLPINLITLGFFTFITNGFLFWLVARIVTGFDIENFLTAIIGALVFSAISFIAHKIVVDLLTKHPE